MRQLALPFLHRPRFAQHSFLAAASNAAARSFLDATAPADWPQHRLAIHGEAGCGKTHLLHAWVARRRAEGHDAALLEAGAIATLAADALLPEGGIALDEADTITDEAPLLHLLNRAADAAIPLVLASRVPPARLPIDLPDLASRLRAMLAIGILPPEDELLDALMGRLLADRQLAVAPVVARYLRLRLPRDASAIRDAVAGLDRLALARGTAITLSAAQALLHDAQPDAHPELRAGLL